MTEVQGLALLGLVAVAGVAANLYRPTPPVADWIVYHSCVTIKAGFYAGLSGKVIAPSNHGRFRVELVSDYGTYKEKQFEVEFSPQEFEKCGAQGY